MSIEYIITLKIFLSEPWVGNVLLAILIVVTIVVPIMVHKRSDFYKRFQQVYDEFLKPGEVKLMYDNDKGKLRHTHHDHQEWEGFIREVKKRIKYKRWKYKAQGLYEKVEKAVNDYEDLVKLVETKITSIFSDRFEREHFDLMIWKEDGEKPLVDYVELQKIPVCINFIISGNASLTERRGDDGIYKLLCHSTLAKTTSESKKNKLRDLILSIANDDDVKELIAKRDKAENDVKPALVIYNNKLARVIQDLRFCRW
jgi:hypothetical protein